MNPEEELRGQHHPHREEDAAASQEGSSAPPDPPLLDAALRLLSARARSVEELRGRLRKKGFEPKAVSDCLQWLLERSLLNDESFSRALIRDRIRFSPRSPMLMVRELKEKGVAVSLAEATVEGVLQEDGISLGDLSARAARDWARKQSSSTRRGLLGERFKPEREKARRRLYGFLARRGFVGDTARSGLDAGEEAARAMEDEARSAGG